MAVSSEIAAFHPHLIYNFDGNVFALPWHSFAFGAECASVPFLQGTRGQMLFLASVPPGTIGGHRHCHSVTPETLWIMLLQTADVFICNGRHHTVPARFFWLDAQGELTNAPLWEHSATKKIMALTAYSYWSARNECIHVHRILAWSLRCPRSLCETRWSSIWDIDHDNWIHCDNALFNLAVMSTPLHRAAAGRAGASARWHGEDAADE